MSANSINRSLTHEEWYRKYFPRGNRFDPGGPIEAVSAVQKAQQDWSNYLASRNGLSTTSPLYDKTKSQFTSTALASNTNTGNTANAASLATSSIGALDKAAGGLGAAITMFDSFKNNADVKDMSGIKDAMTQQAYLTPEASSREALVNQWNNLADIKDDYTYNDIRQNSTWDDVSNTLNSVGAGLAAGSMIGGPIGAAIGGVTGLGASIAGIFTGRDKAKKEAEKLNNLANWANTSRINNLEAGAQSLDATDALNAMRNYAAYGGILNSMKRYDDGGELSTHGSDFTNGARYINAGGTHEENPYEGVQMGTDSEGTPNLVEEGEVVYDDYVFSDRLKPSKTALKASNLPEKYEGFTFARIAEDLLSESKERPNDPISKDGAKVMLQRLQDLQESQRGEEEQVNAYIDMFRNMSPEDMQAVAGEMPQANEQQAMPEQPVVEESGLEMMQPNISMSPGTAPMIGVYGGKLFKTGGSMANDGRDRGGENRIGSWPMRYYEGIDPVKYETTDPYPVILKRLEELDKMNDAESKRMKDDIFKHVQENVTERGSVYKLKSFSDLVRLAKDGKVGPVHEGVLGSMNYLVEITEPIADKIGGPKLMRDPRSYELEQGNYLNYNIEESPIYEREASRAPDTYNYSMRDSGTEHSFLAHQGSGNRYKGNLERYSADNGQTEYEAYSDIFNSLPNNKKFTKGKNGKLYILGQRTNLDYNKTNLSRIKLSKDGYFHIAGQKIADLDQIALRGASYFNNNISSRAGDVRGRVNQFNRIQDRYTAEINQYGGISLIDKDTNRFAGGYTSPDEFTVDFNNPDSYLYTGNVAPTNSMAQTMHPYGYQNEMSDRINGISRLPGELNPEDVAPTYHSVDTTPTTNGYYDIDRPTPTFDNAATNWTMGIANQMNGNRSSLRSLIRKYNNSNGPFKAGINIRDGSVYLMDRATNTFAGGYRTGEDFINDFNNNQSRLYTGASAQSSTQTPIASNNPQEPGFIGPAVPEGFGQIGSAGQAALNTSNNGSRSDSRGSSKSGSSRNTYAYDRSINGEDFENQPYYKAFINYLNEIKDSNDIHDQALRDAWMKEIQYSLDNNGKKYKVKDFNDLLRLATDKKVAEVHQAMNVIANRVKDRAANVREGMHIDAVNNPIASWVSYAGPTETLAPNDPARHLSDKELARYQRRADRQARRAERRTARQSTTDTGEGFDPLRYAGILGNVVGLAGNRLDYTEPEAFMAATANPRSVAFTPIGRYMTPTYMASEEYVTPIMNQLNANRAAVVNNANGNSSAANAAIIAAQNAGIGQIGAARLQGKQYNNAQRNAALQWNSNIDRYNSQGSMQAQAANMNLNNYFYQRALANAQMRTAQRNAYDQARSTNLTALFDNIANVGRENIANNMANSSSMYGYAIDLGDGQIRYIPR